MNADTAKRIECVIAGCVGGIVCLLGARLLNQRTGSSEATTEEEHVIYTAGSSKNLKRTATFILAQKKLELAAKKKKELSKPLKENPGVIQNRSNIENALRDHIMEATDILETLRKQSKISEPHVEFFVPALKNCGFVGHLQTDLDSIAGAIGAADLYGGIALRASNINTETEFALDYWGLTAPPPVEEALGDRNVCLVDHQQTSQLNPSIPQSKIVGCIDHHALQNSTIVTDLPIYVDIRPWGSMSTIIAHNYLTIGKEIPKRIAGILMCAILSDTLNLQSPTTTDWDRKMLTILSEITEVDDIDGLAQQQFKAKSKEFASLSEHAVVCADQKIFSFDGSKGRVWKVGFAVVETTLSDIVLERQQALREEMTHVKHEKDLNMLFLAVVNIETIHSHLLLCGKKEESLAQAAFSGIAEDGVMDLGKRVSRKKDFIPALTKTIQEWEPPIDLGEDAPPEPTILYVDRSEDQNGFIRRKAVDAIS